MNQTIGYDKKELESLMTCLLRRVKNVDDEVRMMEEQGLGLRGNLDWKSSAARLRWELEELKRCLDQLGVLPVPYTVIDSRADYERYYLPNTVEEYCKHQFEQGDL